MKRDSLNVIKSIYKKVDRYRCCPIGATAAAFASDEIKEEEKAVKSENRNIK